MHGVLTMEKILSIGMRVRWPRMGKPGDGEGTICKFAYGLAFMEDGQEIPIEWLAAKGSRQLNKLEVPHVTPVPATEAVQPPSSAATAAEASPVAGVVVTSGAETVRLMDTIKEVLRKMREERIGVPLVTMEEGEFERLLEDRVGNLVTILQSEYIMVRRVDE
jgi:hypothetical protein